MTVRGRQQAEMSGFLRPVAAVRPCEEQSYVVTLALGSQLSARECSRQPEPWEHTIFEAGHGADSLAGEGEDEQTGSMADAGGSAKVGPERRLTIGSRRHEVERPARVEEAGEKAGHNVPALVFERHRWHRHEYVVRQKLH